MSDYKRIKEFDLDYAADSSFLSESAKKHLKNYRILATKTVFLSHSHKDRKLALGLSRLLAKMGVDLYIDWQDEDLPRIPGRETAEQIKEKIRDSDLVLMLATKNAINSKWVPWEIGVADSTLDESRIIVAAVEDSTGVFYGSEYLKLYRRLKLDELDRLYVFEPQYRYVGESFAVYVNRLAPR